MNQAMRRLDPERFMVGEVFVLTFDEHGGFFDHVPPPECQDDTVLAGPGPVPNLKRLGFRVPTIAMGPFAPRKIETAGPYEHCSTLKMIEWRFNLEPMTLRDRHAKNLAEALDFTRRRDAIDLPPFDAPPPTACTEGGGRTQLSVSRRGWVEVSCEGPEDAVCRARLVADDDELELATAPEATVRGGNGVVLEMRLNKAGLTLLAEGSNRLSAVLETITVTRDGAVCRVTSPAILRVSGGR